MAGRSEKWLQIRDWGVAVRIGQRESQGGFLSRLQRRRLQPDMHTAIDFFRRPIRRQVWRRRKQRAAMSSGDDGALQHLGTATNREKVSDHHELTGRNV